MRVGRRAPAAVDSTPEGDRGAPVQLAGHARMVQGAERARARRRKRAPQSRPARALQAFQEPWPGAAHPPGPSERPCAGRACSAGTRTAPARSRGWPGTRAAGPCAACRRSQTRPGCSGLRARRPEPRHLTFTRAQKCAWWPDPPPIVFSTVLEPLETFTTATTSAAGRSRTSTARAPITSPATPSSTVSRSCANMRCGRASATVRPARVAAARLKSAGAGPLRAPVTGCKHAGLPGRCKAACKPSPPSEGLPPSAPAAAPATCAIAAPLLPRRPISQEGGRICQNRPACSAASTGVCSRLSKQVPDHGGHSRMVSTMHTDMLPGHPSPLRTDWPGWQPSCWRAPVRATRTFMPFSKRPEQTRMKATLSRCRASMLAWRTARVGLG